MKRGSLLMRRLIRILLLCEVGFCMTMAWHWGNERAYFMEMEVMFGDFCYIWGVSVFMKVETSR